MIKEEMKVYKALYFDLHIQALKQHYSATNPKNAYKKIQQFLNQHDFSHEQYSGYHSKFKTTDLNVFKIVRVMRDTLPWLRHCVSRFDVANLGVDHDLREVFEEEFNKPKE